MKSTKVLKVINFLILAAMWVFTVINFRKLPEIIPTHFNLRGEADDYGSRNIIWFLPVISTFLFLFLNFLSGKPDFPLLNVPESMKKRPKMLAVFILSIAALVQLVFIEIIFEVFNYTADNPLKIGFVLPVLVAAIFITIIAFFSKCNQN